MLSFRNITKDDCAFILRHWVGNSVVFGDCLAMDGLLSLIESWDTKKYNGDYFEVFGILHGNSLVGTFSLYQRGCDIIEKAVSFGVEIAEENRRKGFGEKSVDMAAKIAKERGCEKILSQARTDNTASVKLHEKCGFLITGEASDRNGNKVYNYVKVL